MGEHLPGDRLGGLALGRQLKGAFLGLRRISWSRRLEALRDLLLSISQVETASRRGGTVALLHWMGLPSGLDRLLWSEGGAGLRWPGDGRPLRPDVDRGDVEEKVWET